MNIFALSKNPVEAAQMHCDKHVVKMIVESAQMLCTAVNEACGMQVTPYKSTHKSHPCTVWAGEAQANALWLHDLMIALGEEYVYRYSKATPTFPHGKKHLTITKMQEAGLKEMICAALPNPCAPRTVFAQAMPEIYKARSEVYSSSGELCDDDVVRAYQRYYKFDKTPLLTYTRRDIPAWLQ